MSVLRQEYQPINFGYVSRTHPRPTDDRQGSFALAVTPAQNSINAVAVRVPPRGMLQTIAACGKKVATSLAGRYVGSYTLKSLAGLLMGLGAIGGLAGGVGLPLFIAGAVLFFVSTSFSCVALEDSRPEALACHLVSSVFAAGTGFLVAFIATTTFGAGAFASLLAGIAEGFVLLLPCIADHANLESYRNQIQARNRELSESRT